MNKLLTDALGFLNSLVAIGMVVVGAVYGYENGDQAGHPIGYTVLGLIVGFLAAVSVFGIDRVMFSIDYPFCDQQRGRAFLEALPLAPADLEKVAHANADRLLRLAPRH